MELQNEPDIPPDETPMGDTVGALEIARGKPSVKHPQGRQVFDRKGLSVYNAKPLESKRETLKTYWAELAYILVSKAASMSVGITKKDYGRLMQLVTTAGIAHDKVFPKDLPSPVSNLVVNMFKGLPSDKVLRVIGQAPIPTEKPLDDTPLVHIP